MNNFLRLIAPVASAAALFALGSQQASALTLNVGGNNYDVTTFTGSYNDNASKFNIPALNGTMPWWGNRDLALSFASALNTKLGTPNMAAGLVNSPYFAFTIPNVVISGTYIPFLNVAGTVNWLPDATNVYVEATLLPAPAPLPLLGAGAAFSMSRCLRRRIRRSR
jgi:hypothetical protein